MNMKPHQFIPTPKVQMLGGLPTSSHQLDPIISEVDQFKSKVDL